MSRNGKTTPFPSALKKLPERSVQSWRERRGSSERRYPRIGRGYRRGRGGTLVGDAAGAEPEACELRVPVLRRDAPRDERARADRARGRRLAAAARAPRVRRRGAQARRAADGRRVPEVREAG